ncbi:Hypothetical predicted protein, partial [Marmota monax]
PSFPDPSRTNDGGTKNPRRSNCKGILHESRNCKFKGLHDETKGPKVRDITG